MPRRALARESSISNQDIQTISKPGKQPPTKEVKKATKKGKGIVDIVKNPVGWAKELVNHIPSKLNFESTKTLEQYGLQKVIGAVVARTPLNPVINGAINAISFGEFDNLKKKYGYDHFYHLSLVLNLESGEKIMMQKNEVIQIVHLKHSNTLNNKTEYYDLNIHQKNWRLDEVINNTKKFMGDAKFYDYDGLLNNCQNFIVSIIKANSWWSMDAEKWIDQMAHRMKEDFEKKDMGFVHKTMNRITKMGSFVSRLVGKGKATKKDVIGHKITLEDIKWLLKNKQFVKYIEKYGWQGL